MLKYKKQMHCFLCKEKMLNEKIFTQGIKGILMVTFTSSLALALAMNCMWSRNIGWSDGQDQSQLMGDSPHFIPISTLGDLQAPGQPHLFHGVDRCGNPQHLLGICRFGQSEYERVGIIIIIGVYSQVFEDDQRVVAKNFLQLQLCRSCCVSWLQRQVAAGSAQKFGDSAQHQLHLVG